MSSSTLCQVCESATGDRACPLCGTVVCDDHFDEGRGCCVDCARTAGGDGGSDPDLMR